MEIINWSYALQIKLEAMNDTEFLEYMKNKGIKYEGKVYTVQEKECLQETSEH